MAGRRPSARGGPYSLAHDRDRSASCGNDQSAAPSRSPILVSAHAPESYPAWPDTRAADPLIRKATIQRFPHVIAVEKHEQHVLVLAVAHARRRPLYWLTRTNL